MKAQLVLLGMALGIASLSMLFSLIPAFSALISVIVLIFAGKKYFLYFWAVQIFLSITMFYAVLNTEMSVMIPMLNQMVYGLPSNNIVYVPTNSTELIHAEQSLPYLGLSLLGLGGIVAVPVGGCYLFYRYIKRVMIGRVRRWNP